MKRLIEYLQNRLQTWLQRRKQLEDNHQIGWTDTGPLPRFITLLQTKKEQAFLEAQKITGETTLMLSEERYPDCYNLAIVYLIGKASDKSEFWHVVDHLYGFRYHECDMRCTTYQLPAFIARG